MIRPFERAESSLVALAFAALLALTYFVYLPGLSGGFLLDDFVNLDALGRLGGVDSWRTLSDYLFGSHTGAGGRPIALASFLLDASDWPAAPYPFKHTSVLFHLLTMVGVIWLALEVARALGYEQRRACAIALLTGAIWGLHPFLVSTVLYIVQRMAILAALFVIFGLGCYVRGRRLLATDRPRAAYLWMTAGVGVFTPLAFLSKQNGGLLPVLALVLDTTVLRSLIIPHTERRRWRTWHAMFILLPIAAIAGYLAANWNARVLNGYESRAFSLYERLLTESRILLDYIHHLAIPRVQTAGLYHDNYPLSTGLIDPPATLLAVIAVLAAAGLGLALRRRFPLISAGVLFFLAAHVLESSVIPLELYFEHRNYLPSVLLALASAAALIRLFDTRGLKYSRSIATALALTVVVALGSFTFARAELWGSPAELALTWANENPGSMRAQQQAAITLLQHGQPRRASGHIAEAISHNPRSSLLRVQHLLTTCASDQIRYKDVLHTRRLISQTRFDEATIKHIMLLGERVAQGECHGLALADVRELIDAALVHPGVIRNGRMLEQLQYARGRLLLKSDRVDEAHRAFLAATGSARNVNGAIQMAGIMASAGHHEQALALLSAAEDDLRHTASGVRARLRRAAIDYPSEIQRLREQILEQSAGIR